MIPRACFRVLVRLVISATLVAGVFLPARAAEEPKPTNLKLEQVAGVAKDTVVEGHSTADGYVAWVTLELSLTAPVKQRGKKLFIVSSEDIAVRAGDTVECNLSGTPIHKRADGSLEVAMVGVKDFKVSPPAKDPTPPDATNGAKR